MEVMINYWAILVAAIASMVMGFLWYGPIFGKVWMKMMGFTPKSVKKMKLTPQVAMTIAFFLSLLTPYVLSHFVDYLEVTTFAGAAQLAFWFWLGLVVPVQASVFLWENKPFKLFVLNTAYNLLVLIVITGILAVWP